MFWLLTCKVALTHLHLQVTAILTCQRSLGSPFDSCAGQAGP